MLWKGLHWESTSYIQNCQYWGCWIRVLMWHNWGMTTFKWNCFILVTSAVSNNVCQNSPDHLSLGELKKCTFKQNKEFKKYLLIFPKDMPHIAAPGPFTCSAFICSGALILPRKQTCQFWKWHPYPWGNIFCPDRADILPQDFRRSYEMFLATCRESWCFSKKQMWTGLLENSCPNDAISEGK